MQCPKCSAENKDEDSICSSCGVDLGLSIPRMVFLNQTSRGSLPPINLPIATMAFQMLRKNKLWLIIGVGVFFLLAFILAYIVANSGTGIYLWIRDIFWRIIT